MPPLCTVHMGTRTSRFLQVSCAPPGVVCVPLWLTPGVLHAFVMARVVCTALCPCSSHPVLSEVPHQPDSSTLCCRAPGLALWVPDPLRTRCGDVQPSLAGAAVSGASGGIGSRHSDTRHPCAHGHLHRLPQEAHWWPNRCRIPWALAEQDCVLQAPGLVH